MNADTFCFGVSYLMLFMGFYFKVKEQYLLWEAKESLKVFLKDTKIEISSAFSEEKMPQIIKEIKEQHGYEDEKFVSLGKRKADAKNNKNFYFLFSAFTHVLGFIS
jgi:transposase